ncbi:MAG: hypothetical protein HYS13_02750 [Planctomycetia bacterium]|nr:hypothetical protein [Planctomycetia bacterium]
MPELFGLLGWDEDSGADMGGLRFLDERMVQKREVRTEGTGGAARPAQFTSHEAAKPMIIVA